MEVREAQPRRCPEAQGALEQARTEAEKAQRSGDFARAGELTYSVIPDLTKKLEAAETAAQHRMLNEVVSEEDIASVVSRWTGIPVDKMLAGERDKLLKMEEALGRRVIGQNEAWSPSPMRCGRARAGLQDPNRPIGSFLMLGPTGVGKTELTKALGQASCSTTTRRWSGSTCRSSWRSTRSRA
jgi:ATP-dependent Clp protease ATP-binding subunit ClpB